MSANGHRSALPTRWEDMTRGARQGSFGDTDGGECAVRAGVHACAMISNMPHDPAAPAVSRVIVGVDASERSRDALALAEALSEPDGRLLIVYAHPFGELASLLTEGDEERLVREGAESVARQAHEVLEGATEREMRIVAGRSPAAVLQQLAVETEAGLIAVGSSERSRLGKVLAGSVAEALLSGSPVPVAVAPAGYASATRPPLGLIGCAYDGSAEARHALRYAGHLAARLAARLQIIGVHQPLGFGSVSVSGSFGYQSANAATREALQAELDDASNLLASGNATTLLLDGPAAATLIAQSGELDLLVAGSRGYGPVRRVLVGSVSRALVRDASCPIVVVPRPGDDQLEASS
jgi:nucleotide-binding universal stress UspA family protein